MAHATVRLMATPFPRRPARAVGIACAFVFGLASSVARAGEGHPTPGKDAPPKTVKAASKSGKPARTSEGGGRRGIGGPSPGDDSTAGPESPELCALRDAEAELFPRRQGTTPSTEWLPLLPPEGGPRVLATGVPPSPPAPPPPSGGELGSGWLNHLEMPDLPVRWDEHLVRYLQYFRDDPRGRSTFANLYRHSGRWREMMRRSLRRKALPEDLMWVAMIESGYDAAARSPAGAAGLWQFMPETAKIYGLTVDHWVDQRLDAAVATDAAADFLADLHRRFGSWELALAAFNMGYVGLSSVVRRYNTNDFWSLARTEGTLPWETTLYVPKILAAAVIAHNLSVFGFGDVAMDGPVETDEVDVPAGTPLAYVAQAAGVALKDIEALNPELRAARTPPGADGDAAYPVKVAKGKGAAAAQALSRLRRDLSPLERYTVRFGETLEQIAAARRTSVHKLMDMNGIAPGEALRGGSVLLVPRAQGAASEPPAPPTAGAPSVRPSVVVPSDLFVYPDRRRVFYRVIAGDTLKAVAAALHVSGDEIRRWNDLDPSARLQDGMTLQAFVPGDVDLSKVVVFSESDVLVLPVGSDEFFASLEHDRRVRRVTVTTRAGETLESIGRRYDVSARTMERINRRSRAETLRQGESVVVYVPTAEGGSRAATAETVQ